MRMLCLSDLHADATIFGESRFAECERAMRLAVLTAIDRRVDVFAFLGDLMDPDSGSSVFRCVRLALAAAVQLHEAGIRSVWMAGNHDVIEDGSGETTLEPLRALGVRRSTWVFDRPEWTGLGPVGVPVEEGTIPCLVLPFVASSHAVDLEEFVRSTWAKAIEGCRRVVVLEHLHVRGAVPGEESDEMARGREVVYPRELLEQIAKESGVELVQLGGHYHRRQRIGGLQIVGAPARFAFGERDNDPGFVIVEVPS